MDIKALHKQFEDHHSPTVEGQIRWLQKQGFAEHQIQQAMIAVYTDIEAGNLPVVYSREILTSDGGKKLEKLYALFSDAGPGGEKYDINSIENGWDLDQILLEVAKRIRTQDLASMLKNIEKFESDMKAKWQKEQDRKNAKPGLWSRIFGKKEPAE